MTNSLSTRELSNVYTPATDDAPAVDGNGDPRFITERDMAEADMWRIEEDDAAAEQYMADWSDWMQSR